MIANLLLPTRRKEKKYHVSVCQKKESNEREVERRRACCNKS